MVLFVQRLCDLLCTKGKHHEVRYITCTALVLSPKERIVILVLHEVRIHDKKTWNYTTRNHCIVGTVCTVSNLLCIDSDRVYK